MAILKLALTWHPCLGEQPQQYRRFRVEIIIVEFVVFTFYVDWADVDRPVIGLISPALILSVVPAHRRPMPSESSPYPLASYCR
jgi:hypothetical protein